MRFVILLILLLVALAGGGAWFFLFKGSSPSDPLPVVQTSSAPAITRSQSIRLTEEDAANIRERFRDVITNVSARRGVQTVGMLDAASLAYFENLKKAALEKDKQALLAGKPFDAYLVLRVRTASSRSELERMSTASVFAIWFINEGILDASVWSGFAIGAVRSTDEGVEGQVLTEGEVMPLNLKFSRERGDWRVDISTLFELANVYLRQSPTTVEETVKQLYTGAVGHAPEPSLWASPSD